MRREPSRLLAYAGLATSALIAVGAVTAAAIVSDQRSADVEPLRAVERLQQRADAALETIADLQGLRAEASCEATARIVAGELLEQRAIAAIDRSSVVAQARLVLNPGDREAFEAARSTTAASLADGFMTEEDAALAAQYAGDADVVAACLERADHADVERPAALTEAAVADMEAEARALEDAAPTDTSRVDQLEAAVAAIADPTLAAADALVSASGVDQTASAAAERADALRAERTSITTLDALEALAAHGEAAVARQAEIDAQAQVAPAPAQPAPVRPAPAPVQPAPVEPEPTQPPDPQPTEQGGGDAIVDPLVP